MRRFWQKEWHKIPFEAFIKTDANKVAGSVFYNEFYKRFFEKYQCWNDLDKDWLEQKKNNRQIYYRYVFKKN